MSVSADSVFNGLVMTDASAAKIVFPPYAEFYSAPTLQSAVNDVALGMGGEVHLIADNAENVTVPAGDTVIIDLNGYAFTGTITNNGTLVIRGAAADSLNITGTGTFTYQ